MGMLECDGTQRTLGARTEVGRSTDCILHIPDRRVSFRHARIAWTRDGWVVRDLGSTNGTILDGRELDTGRDHPIAVGSVLVFGDDKHTWTLVDAAPPVAMAVGASGTVLAEGGLIALPDDENPLASIFEEEPGSWVVELEDSMRQVVDQEIVTVGDQSWRLSLPMVMESTWAGPAKGGSEVALQFEVSLDEEYVRISLLSGAESVQLPVRAHQHMLLVLARARMEDQEAGLSSAEQGWLYTEQLCKMLRTEQHLLNVSVHRARRQFAGLDLAGAGRVIERRRSTRQLRLGFESLSIVPLQ